MSQYADGASTTVGDTTETVVWFPLGGGKQELQEEGSSANAECARPTHHSIFNPSLARTLVSFQAALFSKDDDNTDGEDDGQYVGEGDVAFFLALSRVVHRDAYSRELGLDRCCTVSRSTGSLSDVRTTLNKVPPHIGTLLPLERSLLLSALPPDRRSEGNDHMADTGSERWPFLGIGTGSQRCCGEKQLINQEGGDADVASVWSAALHGNVPWIERVVVVAAAASGLSTAAVQQLHLAALYGFCRGDQVDAAAYWMRRYFPAHEKNDKQQPQSAGGVESSSATATSANREKENEHEEGGNNEEEGGGGAHGNGINASGPGRLEELNLLEVAVMQGSVPLLRLLHQHGCAPALLDGNFNLLHQCSRTRGGNSVAVARFLLDAFPGHEHLGINAKDIDQWTPLHMAAYDNVPDLFFFFLSRGAKVDDMTRDGQNCVILNAAVGGSTILEHLLSMEHSRESNGSSTGGGSPPKPRPFFDVDYVANGATALGHCSPVSSHDETAQILIKHGANVNVIRNGRPLLHLAVEARLVSRVSMMVKAGADLTAKDREGHTALELVEGMLKREKNQANLVTLTEMRMLLGPANASPSSSGCVVS